MAVLVNFKICDNAKECSGVSVCPTGALFYDEDKKSLAIDNEKCISCGRCERECPIGAIRVAKTTDEYNKIKKELDNDVRTIKDLFVDRYGAVSISDFFCISVNEIDEKVKNNCLTIIEIYNPETAECLLKSIPIKELTKHLPNDTLYYKAQSNEVISKYDIKELPALLIFKENKLLGHIDGYFNIDEIDLLCEKIMKVINKS